MAQSDTSSSESLCWGLGVCCWSRTALLPVSCSAWRVTEKHEIAELRFRSGTWFENLAVLP